jgi:uncharacterized protein (DUF58 family)
MKRLTINPKKRYVLELIGKKLSTFKGEGLEFKELREYNNEDAKRIDWKISAKMNKPYVKVFEEERELNIIITILVSGNLHFGSIKLKSELIAEIVEILSYIATNENDRVTLIFAQQNPIILKPSKSKKIVYSYVEKVLNFNYLGKDYPKNIDFLNKLKKGILFLIGDFHKIPNLTLKHETYAIIVRDFLEEYPKLSANLIDPINFSQKEAKLSPNSLKFIHQNDKLLYSIFAQKKIKFTKIYTHENTLTKLAELLK